MRIRLLGLALLAQAWSGCGTDDDHPTYQGLPLDSGVFTESDASAVLTGDSGSATGGPGSGAQPDGGAAAGGGIGSPGGTGSLGGGMPGAPDSGTAGGGSTGIPDGGIVSAPDGGGTTDGGGATTGGGNTRPDQGMGDGKDVVTIGDSWMNLGFDDTSTIGIQASLERASKRDYRNYGIGGTTLLDNSSIPAQYAMAKAQGAIKTVVMTGGGNDVLQDIELGPIGAIFGTPGCIDGVFNDACKKRIDDVAARLQTMWAEMARDGVLDVVIVAYTKKALGGEYTMTQAYSTQKITPICTNVPAPLRCSSLETDMVVPDLTLRDDGIHPDDASYDKIGAALWAHMQKMGMRR